MSSFIKPKSPFSQKLGIVPMSSFIKPKSPFSQKLGLVPVSSFMKTIRLAKPSFS